MTGARLVVGVAVAGLGAGCSGEVGFSDPPADGGDHLRPGLTVSVGVAPEAEEVARALGWTDGVPGAEVRAHRIGTEFAWKTAVTDEGGTAHLPHLVSGRYRLAVYRPLTEEESAAVGVSALAAGSIAGIAAGGSEHAAELVPNRTGSLVISEVYAPGTPSAEGFSYDFHMFFELYNNSDRTVFLDGLAFGLVHLFDVPTPTLPCSRKAPFHKDPEGVWGYFLHRFPGGGGEHPLPPGTAAVVARDAIDHSVIDPRFPDLSHADFELLGSGDVDNPDVPNLPETGFGSWFDGHGLLFYDGHTLFLSRELDIASLDRGVLPERDFENFRVPATHLIDVLSLEQVNALQEQRNGSCDGIVHGSFDQLGGGFRPLHPSDWSYLALSVQRIRLPGAEGAAGRLQDTNVSAVDLVAAPATPGTIPP